MAASTPHRIDAADCTVVVLSDLHKYSGISTFNKGENSKAAWERRHEVFESFNKADHVVFNGDIFDIECAIKQEEKIAESVEWLKKRMDEAPATQFHFILGNHEAYRLFIEAMKALERDLQYGKNFHFHENYLQINDSLFVHGDEYLGVAKQIEALKKPKGRKGINPEIEMESNSGNRRRELDELPHWKRRGYEMLNALHHKKDNIWKGLQHIVSTLYSELEKGDAQRVAAFRECKHIFSGHTHQPYMVHFKDKYFYNPGAAVEYMQFRPFHIEMKKGITMRVAPLLKKDKAEFFQRPPVNLGEKATKKYFVTSDLHMFGTHLSRYDSDSAVKNAIDASIANADVVVLNGDTFELFFTKDRKKSVAHAIKWLDDLAKKYPKKEIHLVLGEHEAVKEFVTAAAGLAKHSDTFKFHPHAFQPSERTIFVHGDEIMKGRFKPREYYSLDEAPFSKMAHKIKDQEVRRKLRDSTVMAKKIGKALDEIPGVHAAKNISNIFVGHTHLPCVDQPLEDKKWVTNTGAAINAHVDNAKFAGVTFDMATNGDISPPRVINQPVDIGVARIHGF